MVGIIGINEGPVYANYVEQAQIRAAISDYNPVGVREKINRTDEADFSYIGKAVAVANDLAEKIAEERVAQAQKNIEEGVYRIQEVVRIVAARISRYIELTHL